MPPTPDKLHLGCGLVSPTGWLNVDGSWNAKLAKRPMIRKALVTLGVVGQEALDVGWSRDLFIHDVRKPLPWPDGSFRAVYTSHLLEHLYFETARTLLRECRRVLKPGGVLRVVVPDLEDIVRAYGERRRHPSGQQPSEAHLPGHEVCARLMMRPRAGPRGNFLRRYYNATADFHTHKWMWDAESLAAEMTLAGFKDCRRRECFDSAIDDIKTIEKADRVVNGGLAVEGVRA